MEGKYIPFYRSQEFIAHLVRFRSVFMFSTKLSSSFYVQYNSGDDLVSGNFRMRYNPREGTDLYVVYNTGINSDIPGEIPRLPLQDFQSFIIKYTYTFVISIK